MKFKGLILSFFVSFGTLFGAVNHSILPQMNKPFVRDLNAKINKAQKEQIDITLNDCSAPLRVMSFNMLFNLPFADQQLEPANRWPSRGPRLIEYLGWASPDLIGSQELQWDQIQKIDEALNETYSYYGMGTRGWDRGDVPTVFYKKNRLKLLEGNTYYFSSSLEKPVLSPSSFHNTFVVCHFLDLCNQREFYIINTHLAFSNIEKRYFEAKVLRDFINTFPSEIPIILTGDFNTFPFRQELELPFYDGDEILTILEDSSIKDSQKLAVLGHFGPISSTNFCIEKKKAFSSSVGTPGVILDHIFVSPSIGVIRHGIDPADVDGYFPSDHFPVVVDLQFYDSCLVPSS